MKKILGVVILGFCFLMLGACSSQSMDGTYYQIYDWSDGLVLSHIAPLKISGKDVRSSEKKRRYTIDIKKHTLTNDKDIVSYTYSDDIIAFDDVKYVRAGTKKEKELEKKAVRIEEE